MLPVTYQAASISASTASATKTLPAAMRSMVRASVTAISVGHCLQRRQALGRPAFLEGRGHFDEGVGIEPVEARAERQRISADVADLDPVAGVDGLGQIERPRQDVDRIAGGAADAEGHDLLRVSG